MAKKKEKTPKKGKEKKPKKKDVDKDRNIANLTDPGYYEVSEGEKTLVTVKFGKPVLQISYSTIKSYTLLAGILITASIFYAIKLIIKAIGVRIHFGYYINMISKPDGDILPSSQAIPTLLFLVLDILIFYLVYKLFSEELQHKINSFLFMAIMAGVGLVILVLVIFIVILAHIYSEHASLHDGMKDAMKQYGSDSVFKAQIDRLQIEFQCCGSKKYEEWYGIQWYDASLVKGGNKSENSSTPFSCCSRASLFPCIHHDIEKTGTTYLYTPEYNLSISTNGCYEMIKQRKKQVGWTMIGSMFVLLVLQMLVFVPVRFLQTAHFERGKFDGRRRIYTVWLLGCYSGKGQQSQAPEPPPVPPELMDDK